MLNYLAKAIAGAAGMTII